MTTTTCVYTLTVEIGVRTKRITVEACDRQNAIWTALELMGTGARVVACGREGQW